MSKSTSAFTGVLITVLCIFAATIQNVDAITECKGVNMTFTEEQVMHLTDCMKLIGIEKITDVDFDNAGCFSKCVMQKKGLIDVDGKPHKEKIMEMLGGSVPDNLKLGVNEAMEKCLEVEGNEVDVKEEQCNSFIPLAMCVHSAFTSICQ